jgi:hypothetical protein
VLLCWLALLLVRIIEIKTGRTWTAVHEDLHALHVGVFTGPAGTFTQTSEPTPATRTVLAALEITPPKKVLRLDAATGPGPGRLRPPGNRRPPRLNKRFHLLTSTNPSPGRRPAAEPGLTRTTQRRRPGPAPRHPAIHKAAV